VEVVVPRRYNWTLFVVLGSASSSLDHPQRMRRHEPSSYVPPRQLEMVAARLILVALLDAFFSPADLAVTAEASFPNAATAFLGSPSAWLRASSFGLRLIRFQVGTATGRTWRSVL
jgi:hypothetical protein